MPAVLLVVAADDPWMPQAAEHLAALDALGVEHGVVAVTRCDLADPAPAAARAAAELRRTSLRGSPVVPVSSRTGAGLDELRARLVELVRGLPKADPRADVRLWVDRRFTVSGAGTVVTGTLPAGTVARGDTLSTGTGTVRVRGIESLDQPVDSVSGVARVALNVTGDVRGLDRRQHPDAPGAYSWTEILDARVTGDATRLPTLPMLHVGAVSLVARCRPLDGDLVRLTLSRPLPLRVGDRALLRDPGSRAGVGRARPGPAAATAAPAGRRRRPGADALRGLTGKPDLVSEVGRREVVGGSIPCAGSACRDSARTEAAAVVRAGPWLMSADRARRGPRTRSCRPSPSTTGRAPSTAGSRSPCWPSASACPPPSSWQRWCAHP